MNSPIRVLYVDDFKDAFELIRDILHEYEVATAHSVAEALRKVATEEFDLYLLDYYLPDGTGLTLFKSIREFDKTTPIIFVTNSNLIIEELRSIGIGEGLVLKKDLPGSLLAAISRVLVKQTRVPV